MPGSAARHLSRLKKALNNSIQEFSRNQTFLSIGSRGRFVEVATGVDEARRQVLARQLWAVWRPRWPTIGMAGGSFLQDRFNFLGDKHAHRL